MKHSFKDTMLNNRHVLVTGGASGLGLAMATLFLELGASVSLLSRSAEKLASAQQKLGDKCFTVAADVRDYEALAKGIRELTDLHGPLTDLVNNAAGNFLCASEDLSPGGFRAVIETVLVGTFNCSHIFGNSCIARKASGNILNIVTTYAETGSAFVLPSASAKAGVQAMTKSLAFEWGSYGIRVNAIAPGPFPTEGAWKRLVPSADMEKSFKDRIPLGRFGDPSELACLAAYLLSDMASYVNGEVMTIDGGEVLNAGQFNFVAGLMPREDLRAVFQKMRPK
jgi:NAD(P)-dependent dehydrogenase (short-subunit alcohol dehydrogenase family)